MMLTSIIRYQCGLLWEAFEATSISICCVRIGTDHPVAPGQADKCVLVQLAVPSRRGVPEYQRLQRQVHELVGQISGTAEG